MKPDEFDDEFDVEDVEEEKETGEDWEHELNSLEKNISVGEINWHDWKAGTLEKPEKFKIENFSVRDYKDKKMIGKKYLMGDVFYAGKGDISKREFIGIPQQFGTQLKNKLGTDWANKILGKTILVVNFGEGKNVQDKDGENVFVNMSIRGETFYNMRILIK